MIKPIRSCQAQVQSKPSNGRMSRRPLMNIGNINKENVDINTSKKGPGHNSSYTVIKPKNNRSSINQKINKVQREVQFKEEQLSRREQEIIPLREYIDELSNFKKERIHFISYLTYFTNKVNEEYKKGKTYEFFKPESYFKALHLFDVVIAKLKNRSQFDFKKCMVIAQTCMFMSSKIHDIYSIEFNKIE